MQFSGPYIERGGRGGGGRGAEVAVPARKTKCDFAGLFLLAILLQNLYTGDTCEGVQASEEWI